MTDFAANDFPTIRTRIAEIQAMAVPMCPSNPGRTLHYCLRSPTPCGDTCPHVLDWTGPEKETAS